MKEGSVPEDAQFRLNYRFLDDSAPARLQQVLTEMKTNPFDSRTSIEIIDKGKRPALVLHENSRKLFENCRKWEKKSIMKSNMSLPAEEVTATSFPTTR